jgi:2-hydroxychromene-2-carboxylate isomerase
MIVRFFFDFISPYAYLAWQKIHAVVEPEGGRVQPVPVLFAALLDAHGTLGPAEVPAKRRYLIKDVSRRAAMEGVAIDAPFAHPFNPLLMLRVASLPAAAQQRRRLIDGLFRATWAERRDVTDPAVVGALAAEAGLPEALKEAQAPDAKARLRQQTEQAIALGVFGVPTAELGGELFWGTDSLILLERHLTGQDKVPKDLAQRWESLPRQAERRK